MLSTSLLTTTSAQFLGQNIFQSRFQERAKRAAGDGPLFQNLALAAGITKKDRRYSSVYNVVPPQL